MLNCESKICYQNTVVGRQNSKINQNLALKNNSSIQNEIASQNITFGASKFRMECFEKMEGRLGRLKKGLRIRCRFFVKNIELEILCKKLTIHETLERLGFDLRSDGFESPKSVQTRKKIMRKKYGD